MQKLNFFMITIWQNNVKVIMKLLRGNTRSVQIEVFHVFKIIVANPNKSKPVIEILVRNKEKLIEFWKKFRKESKDKAAEDDHLNEQMNSLVATLEQMDESMIRDPSPPAAPEASASSREKKL